MGRPSLATVHAFALAALVVIAPACRRHRAVSLVHDDVYGTLGGKEPTLPELGDDVRFVRARLADGLASPPARATASPGRRVFVGFYVGARRAFATGLGPTLGASLAAAADDARPRLAGWDLRDVRVTLEIAIGRTADAGSPVPPEELGAEGFLVARDPQHVGWVTPTELLSLGLLVGDEKPILDDKRIQKELALRLGAPCPTVDAGTACKRTRFRTLSVVEASPLGPLRKLARGRFARPAELSSEELRRRIGLAADHLAGLVDEHGRYAYLYDPVHDREVDDDYSVIRHAGATHSLFEGYEELKNPAVLAAGLRALDWLDRHLTADQDRLLLADEDNAYGAIGGTGLALVAFAKHAAVTRDSKYLPRLQAMGRFLVKQLGPDGHFLPYQAPTGPKLELHEVLYYPGEAMLGLMRLYALDPRKEWLEAVERAAAYRLATPYTPKSDAWRDYWYALTLAELHRTTKDARWSSRAAFIATGIMGDQDDDEEDLAGSASFTMMPGASGLSTALEALTTEIALARFAGVDDAVMMVHARRAATLIAAEQHDAEGSFSFPNPKKALGGIRGDPWSHVVRIDLAQHAMMAFLCLLRVQRDPAFGKVGAPSPLLVTPLPAP